MSCAGVILVCVQLAVDSMFWLQMKFGDSWVSWAWVRSSKHEWRQCLMMECCVRCPVESALLSPQITCLVFTDV